MLLIVLLVFGMFGSGLSASPRFADNLNRNEHHQDQDSVVMADVIGSGALNFQHYFYTLGVACENRNRVFWKSIDAGYRSCEYMMSNKDLKIYYGPYGSFNRACANWKINLQCQANLALDLDDCLGSKKGTDALRFMEAYAKFTCGDIRDAEAHLVSRFTKGDVAPGVFRCFPDAQDRISNCVKQDQASSSFCSQFDTVYQCYGQYFTDQTCNDPKSIMYIRDLFHSMKRDLKCPQYRDDWFEKFYPGSRGLSARPPYKHYDPSISTSRRPPTDDRLISSPRRTTKENRYISTSGPPVAPGEYPNIIFAGKLPHFDERLLSVSRQPEIHDRFISSTISSIEHDGRNYFILKPREEEDHGSVISYSKGMLRPVSVRLRPFRRASDRLRTTSSTTKPESSDFSTTIVTTRVVNRNRKAFRSV